MSRYGLRYIDIKEKSFNKEKTLKDFKLKEFAEVIRDTVNPYKSLTFNISEGLAYKEPSSQRDLDL